MGECSHFYRLGASPKDAFVMHPKLRYDKGFQSKPIQILMDYSEKLKDARWQKRRLEIFERDKWRCGSCLRNTEDGGLQLQVHHKEYVGDPWDAPDDALITLCSLCHDAEHRRKDLEKSLIEELRVSKFTARHLELLILGINNSRFISSQNIRGVSPGSMKVVKSVLRTVFGSIGHPLCSQPEIDLDTLLETPFADFPILS